MNQRTYSDEAIILSRKNYSEADRIITVLAKRKGKISLIAKGIRKLKSKKRGHLEVFSLVKFSAANSHSLDIITEVETINDFKSIRNNLNKVSLAYYLIEVVSKVTKENEAHENVFEILKNTLESLESTSKLKTLRLNFIRTLLIDLGFLSVNKKVLNLDAFLEEITERRINSYRVGKILLKQN